MRTQPRRPRATRAERASSRRSSCTGRSRSLARSPRPSSPRQVNREETVRLGQLHREREKATSQREEERGKKEERASPSTPPPPPQLHRPHARPTRLELVDVELGGRVVRVPRARLGLARAGRRHLVKVVRRNRPRRARRARQARRRADAPDEVGDEAAGEGGRGAGVSAEARAGGRNETRRRPTHPVQPVWCDAPRPLPFSQLKNSAREEGVRQ